MPLQGSYNLNSNINLAKAYIVITEVKVKYTTCECSILIEIYKDKASHATKKSPVEVTSINIANPAFDSFFSESVLSQSGKTCVSQGYVYLNTLPQFTNFIRI
jgi:hypothetical protein